MIDSRNAVFSPCRTYRYLLYRKLCDQTSHTVCTFCMLNPSTADETKNDPTVTRCISYAKRWGFSQLIVTNLFALRSTDPKLLYEHADPIGQENNKYILQAAQLSHVFVCAWGVHGALHYRGHNVRALLQSNDIILSCLGTTKDGHPRHPLYLPRHLEYSPWNLIA